MNASEVRLRVAALVETGGVDGFVTVAEVAEHVAASPRSIGQAPQTPWGSQCRGERTSRGLERTEREFSIRRCGDGRRHGRTGSRRNDNTAQLAP